MIFVATLGKAPQASRSPLVVSMSLLHARDDSLKENQRNETMVEKQVVGM